MKKLISIILLLALLASLCACGDKTKDVTGKYLCVGEAYGEAALTDPGDGSYLELKKGGKGSYYSGYAFTLKWSLDGEAFTGTVTFLGMDQDMSGTLKDGVIDVKYGDMRMRFLKEGATLPTTDPTAQDANATAAPVLAGTLGDAFLGSTMGGFVSETTAISYPSNWYGTVCFYDFVGIDSEDMTADIWGIFDTDTNTGKPFFEVWEVPYDERGSNDEALLSMYVFEDATTILPDIGSKDAWLVDTYLSASDTADYTVTLDNGAIDINVTYSGSSGSCSCRFFLREDGAHWDEDNDPLPPSYADYAATLTDSSAPASSPTAAPAEEGYGKSTSDATGIVDFETLKKGYSWLSEQSDAMDWNHFYEEVREQFGGVNGRAKIEDKYAWSDEYHAYRWETASGDWVQVSFKVNADGSEKLSSFNWSPSMKG